MTDETNTKITNLWCRAWKISGYEKLDRRIYNKSYHHIAEINHGKFLKKSQHDSFFKKISYFFTVNLKTKFVSRSNDNIDFNWSIHHTSRANICWKVKLLYNHSLILTMSVNDNMMLDETKGWRTYRVSEKNARIDQNRNQNWVLWGWILQNTFQAQVVPTAGD